MSKGEVSLLKTKTFFLYSLFFSPSCPFSIDFFSSFPVSSTLPLSDKKHFQVFFILKSWPMLCPPLAIIPCFFFSYSFFPSVLYLHWDLERLRHQLFGSLLRSLIFVCNIFAMSVCRCGFSLPNKPSVGEPVFPTPSHWNPAQCMYFRSTDAPIPSSKNGRVIQARPESPSRFALASGWSRKRISPKPDHQNSALNFSVELSGKMSSSSQDCPWSTGGHCSPCGSSLCKKQRKMGIPDVITRSSRSKGP